jgi:hypothetical protein
MSIQIRPTPNPNARKFVLSRVRFTTSRNFTRGNFTEGNFTEGNFTGGSTVDEPLAAQLLTLPGVYNVLLAQDFVTVNKTPETAWPPLEAAVVELLTAYEAQSGA